MDRAVKEYSLMHSRVQLLRRFDFYAAGQVCDVVYYRRGNKWFKVGAIPSWSSTFLFMSDQGKGWSFV